MPVTEAQVMKGRKTKGLSIGTKNALPTGTFKSEPREMSCGISATKFHPLRPCSGLLRWNHPNRLQLLNQLYAMHPK